MKKKIITGILGLMVAGAMFIGTNVTYKHGETWKQQATHGETWFLMSESEHGETW
ncbi:hypothetical protein [Bacillus albus]|uniref:hypothetical protein n=1 Tax=Bacillus albus TaxID=2026189 RepID=UPI0013ECA9D0|nr:hypothetical protein [Bacillus albus]